MNGREKQIRVMKNKMREQEKKRTGDESGRQCGIGGPRNHHLVMQPESVFR